MTKTYNEYTKDYSVALTSIAECLNHSHLSRLENIALRFAYAVEEKTLDLKNGNERDFLSAVLVKVTNEMFAAIGSLRNGALLASHHHARSVFELFAAIEHVYCKPEKRERKLEKFIEYSNVAKYMHYVNWHARLSTGDTSKDELNQNCYVTERKFQELEKKLPEWLRIWKPDLGSDPSRIQNWHYPATIEQLFQSSQETKNLWSSYEKLCHATHLSPLGKSIVGGHFLIGFPKNGDKFDYQKINRPIIATIIGAQRITTCLNQVAKTGLIDGILDWIPDN